MTDAPYCATTDLLIGDVPTSNSATPAKYVQDAADEIDSKIGYIYHTPVDVTDSSAVSRPAKLLLKRLNTHIATARILMAMAIPAEDKSANAYAIRLLTEAEAALAQIASGEIILDGAPRQDAGEPVPILGPIIGNKDPESQVDAFYDRVTNPNFCGPAVLWPYHHDGLVR